MGENDENEAFMNLYKNICSYSASHEKTMRNGSNFGEMLKALHSILTPYYNDSYIRSYNEIWNKLIENAVNYYNYRISRDEYLDNLYELLNKWVSIISILLENKGFIKLNGGW